MCPDLRFSGNADPERASDAEIAGTASGKIVDLDVVQTGNHPGGPRNPTGAGPLIAHAASETDSATDNSVLASPTDAVGTDAALAHSAVAALERDPLLSAGKVRPVVRGGWLILEGQVEARTQRQAAEDAVRGLAGIRGVSNNILIESEVMVQRVSRKIDEVFTRNARLNASRISVTASNHKIILCGSVHSRLERAEAEAAAWGVVGVADVVNRIRATGSSER